MRKRTYATFLAAALAGAAAAPAAAADLPAGLSLSGDTTLVSDYRYRGVSQSDRRPALQGSFTLSHASGVYGSVWGSSIADYVYNGADVEIDFTAGFRRTFGGTTIDAGLVYFYFPNSGGINSDFFEPFVSAAQEFGPVTATATVAYAPRQAALSLGDGDEDNLYLGGDLSVEVPATPLTLTAHYGRSFGPSYLSIGDEYGDWSLGGSAEFGPLSLGLSYVDSDARSVTPSGRNAAGPGVVASIGVSF